MRSGTTTRQPGPAVTGGPYPLRADMLSLKLTDGDNG